MKRKSIISMLLLSMMMGMFSTSCQDMLSPDSERHSYQVGDDILYSYWGILKSLQNIGERYVILNECRGDLVDASPFVSDTIGAIVNFGDVEDPEDWKDGACSYLQIRDYYHIINSCNAYIAMCDTTRTVGTEEKSMLREYSQVLAIRAWVYMQLLYAYGPGNVPFYTEPMLTTDDINAFVSNMATKPKVTPELLAEELGPELEKMEPMEEKYGLPEYYNYGDVNDGNSHFVCHSSKCMFPVSIVLGDLYLLANKYEDAALHYYNYINTQECGPLAVDKCYSTGLIDDKLDYPIYSVQGGIPYNEKGAVSRSTEAITVIPSNKGKLEGKVMTDINRLFGFEAEMRTSSSEGAGASVSLSRNYDRELIPSKGYEALCDSQKYEIYVGTTYDSDGRHFSFDDNTTLEVLPGVGDARRSWIYGAEGQQWTFRKGDDELYGKMVSKQNPSGSFSTTYPVIYRKSTVWLRFAEALNRAGFPSYAFAILKNGLCNNRWRWFPESPNMMVSVDGSYVPMTDIMTPYFDYSGKKQNIITDYTIYDSLFVYIDTNGEETKMLPEDYDGDNKKSTYAELEAYLTDYFQQEYNANQTAYEEYLAKVEEDPTLEPVVPMDAPRTIDKNRVMWKIPNEQAVSNQPVDSCNVACYYLDRRELDRSSNYPFLNFYTPFMRGQNTQQLIYYKVQGKLFNRDVSQDRIPIKGASDDTYTIGVHQRGCGFIRYNDPKAYRSSYTYVGMVQKKLKEEYQMELTEKQIYGEEGDYLEDVQNAVEDLIIDEMALELAFEGTRFSDLCRVALRRGDPYYLAKRVSKRHDGVENGGLRESLHDMTKWFLPVPKE